MLCDIDLFDVTEIIGTTIFIFKHVHVTEIIEMNSDTLYVCSCYRIIEKIMLFCYML